MLVSIYYRQWSGFFISTYVSWVKCDIIDLSMGYKMLFMEDPTSPSQAEEILAYTTIDVVTMSHHVNPLVE